MRRARRRCSTTACCERSGHEGVREAGATLEMRLKKNDVNGTAAMMLSSRLSGGSTRWNSPSSSPLRPTSPRSSSPRPTRSGSSAAEAGRRQQVGLAYSLILCRRCALRMWRPGSRAGSLVGSGLSPGCARTVLQRAWPPSAAVRDGRWAAASEGGGLRTCHQSFEQPVQAIGMRRAPVVAVGGAH